MRHAAMFLSQKHNCSLAIGTGVECMRLMLVSQASPFAPRGRVWSIASERVVQVEKYVNQRNRSHAPHGNTVCPAGQHMCACMACDV